MSTNGWQQIEEQAKAAGLNVKSEGKGWRVGGVKVRRVDGSRLCWRVFGTRYNGQGCTDVEAEQVVAKVQFVIGAREQRAADVRTAKERAEAIANTDKLVTKYGGLARLAEHGIRITGGAPIGIIVERQCSSLAEADAVLTALLWVKTEGK